MNKLSREDQLVVILQRLRDFKRQGGEEGIDDKIEEVELQLRKQRDEEVLEMTLNNKLKIKLIKKFLRKKI